MNTMTRKLFQFLLIAACAVLVIMTPTSPAHAALVVTDPGAYGHLIDQLKNAQEQLAKLTEQGVTLTQAKDTLYNIKGQLEGSYNRATGMYSDIKKAQKRTGDFSEVFNRPGGKVKGYGEDYKELDVYIDKIFKDPRDKDYNAWLLKDAKAETRAKVYKNSMKAAEISLSETQTKLKKISALSEMIDSTKNQKDAQDLSNRLLVELLLGQQEMIGLLANLAEAYALTNYTGTAQRPDSLESTPQRAKETAVDKALSEASHGKTKSWNDQDIFSIIDGR